jgi:tRNA(fMet)-specific endonuclease VapC
MREPRGAVGRAIGERAGGEASISVVTLAELRYGIDKVGSSRLRESLEEVLDYLPVHMFASPADAHYARLRVHLERVGTPIGPNDLFIAAHALALDLTLVTANVREFSRVPNLRVENWLD